MKTLHAIAFILVIIGGLNWLLVGLFNLDVVAYLGTTVAKIVYVLVGLSAVWLVITHKNDCKHCEKGAAPTAPAQQM